MDALDLIQLFWMLFCHLIALLVTRFRCRRAEGEARLFASLGLVRQPGVRISLRVPINLITLAYVANIISNMSVYYINTIPTPHGLDHRTVTKILVRRKKRSGRTIFGQLKLVRGDQIWLPKLVRPDQKWSGVEYR